MSELLPKEDLPQGFLYPQELINLVERDSVDIGPWQILSGKWLRVRFSGLKERYPDRELIPFARRLDSDDIACWDRSSPGKVFIVHDFASPGWEQRRIFTDFDAWYKEAQKEAELY